MRQGQNKQRMRSRNNNTGGNRRGPNPLTRSYESNGPDVKVRGTAHHIGEKYLQLARDAQTSGDPVMAESYLQHAEHYFRIIATAQLQQQQAQEGYVRPEGEAAADEADDDDLVGGLPDRFASPLERIQSQPALAPQPNFAPQPNPYLNRQAAGGERPQQDRLPQDRQAADRAAPDASPERPYDERPRERQDEERPRYERPARQDRFQQNRYGQDRQQTQQDRQQSQQDRQQPQQGQNRDFRQDRQQSNYRQDRNTQQDRNGQQDRNTQQDRNAQQDRDSRQPRDFRQRRDMNGEPRSYAPEAPQEGAILPSFITAPTRPISQAEPFAATPTDFAGEAAPDHAAEMAPAAERNVRRRRPRAGFEEKPGQPPAALLSDTPEGGD